MYDPMFSVTIDMIVFVDPGDDPDFIKIAVSVRKECETEVNKLGLFAALCAEINRNGVVDSQTNTWYPGHQIRKITYES